MTILKNHLKRGARSKGFKIFLAVFAVFILGVAATFFYSYSSTPSTHAQSTLPGTGTVQVSNTTNSVTISLASSGPYSADFRYQVCWIPAPNYNSPWPEVCVWSPWASSAGIAGQWSDWIWPLHSDEMQGGSQVFVQNVETRPLPPGVTSLTGVSVGIQLSEDNGGTLVGTSNNILCPGSITYGGSATAYGHLYGSHCDSNSDTPDVLRIYIASNGSMGALETSSNLPSTMTAGQTLTSNNGQPLSITMQNVGKSSWLPAFSVNELNGTQGPNCDEPLPTSGGTINDAPASGTTQRSCSMLVNMASTNYFLSHQGSLSMGPENIPIAYNGVTQTITYYPATTRTITYDVPCSLSPSLMFNFIPSAYAIPMCGNGGTVTKRISVPESWTVSYSGGGYQLAIPSGQSYTFPLSSVSAPSTASGPYRELWQMTNGASFGNPYTWQIQVGPGITGTAVVNSVNAATGQPVPASWTLLGDKTIAVTNQSQSSASVDAGPWSLVVTPNSAGSNFAMGKLLNPTIADVRTSHTSLASILQNIFSPAALAVSSCDPKVAVTSAGLTVCSGGNEPGQSVTSNAQVIAWNIYWQPVAQMNVTPSSVTLTSPTSTAQVQVSNPSTSASGSMLGWQTQGVPNWLMVNPSSDMSPGVAQGATDTVTFSANTSTPGSYTGTVKFVGYSLTSQTSTPIATKSVSVTLTIPNPAVTSVTPSCNPSSIFVKGSSACTATVQGTGSYDPSVTWSVASGPGAIDGSGNYAATSTPGTAVIKACSAMSGYTNVCGTSKITVLAVTGVTVSVSPTTMPVGSGATASCTVTLSDGTTNHQCTYTSSNASVATVDAQSGVVQGVAMGTAAIVATSKQDTSKYASQEIVVWKDGTPPACIIDPSSCSGGGNGGGSNNAVTVQVTADPMVISQAETATCRATVQNATTTAVLWNAANGTITGSGNTVTLTPSTASTATCKAVSVANPSASDSKTITVENNRNPINAPTTSISASPTTVLVPGATTIDYSANHVSSCTLSGGSFNNSTINLNGQTSISSSTIDHPTGNTTYTISCQGTNNYTSTTSSASVTVTVSNPGIHETNP